MDTRYIPIVGLTHDDDDANSHMSDIPLQFPSSAHFPSNNSALVMFSQAGGDPVQNVHSLQPIPNQTGVNPGQLQYHVTYAPSVLAVLGRQEAVLLVTQRARESQNDQRETARRALLHQTGEILAATHQYEAAARQNFVNTLTKKNEAHNYNAFGNSNMKQTRDFPKDRGNCYRDSLRKQIKLLKIRSMEARRTST